MGKKIETAEQHSDRISKRNFLILSTLVIIGTACPLAKCARGIAGLIESTNENGSESLPTPDGEPKLPQYICRFKSGVTNGCPLSEILAYDYSQYGFRQVVTPFTVTGSDSKIFYVNPVENGDIIIRGENEPPVTFSTSIPDKLALRWKDKPEEPVEHIIIIEPTDLFKVYTGNPETDFYIGYNSRKNENYFMVGTKKNK